MTEFLLGIVVFVAAVVLDYAYVRYQESVSAKREHAAARWSVALYAIGSVGWMTILDASKWYMIPECLGLYVGTVVAMRRSKRLVSDRSAPEPGSLVDPVNERLAAS